MNDVVCGVCVCVCVYVCVCACVLEFVCVCVCSPPAGLYYTIRDGDHPARVGVAVV